MPHRWDHEHRWGERQRVNIPVKVTGPEVCGIHGRVRNVSLSGALIMADIDLPVNSVIEIDFALQSSAPIAGVVRATITRKIQGHVGVEWCEFAPHTVKQVIRSASARS